MKPGVSSVLGDDGSSLLSELPRVGAGPFNWLRRMMPILFFEIESLGDRRAVIVPSASVRLILPHVFVRCLFIRFIPVGALAVRRRLA